MAGDLSDWREENVSAKTNNKPSLKAVLLLVIFLLGFVAGAFLMNAFIEPSLFKEPVGELKQCLDSKKVLDLQVQDLVASLDACVKESITGTG